MIHLVLSEDEVLALNRLIDLAVRQGGLEVAPMAVTLSQRLIHAKRAGELTRSRPPLANNGAAAVAENAVPDGAL